MAALLDGRERVHGRDAADVEVQVAHPDHVVELLVQAEAAPAQLRAEPLHELRELRAPLRVVLRRHVRVHEGQRRAVDAQGDAHATLEQEEEGAGGGGVRAEWRSLARRAPAALTLLPSEAPKLCL